MCGGLKDLYSVFSRDSDPKRKEKYSKNYNNEWPEKQLQFGLYITTEARMGHGIGVNLQRYVGAHIRKALFCLASDIINSKEIDGVPVTGTPVISRTVL